MAEPARRAAVQLVDGIGTLSRRGDELLFTPSSSAVLLDAFAGAPTGAAFDAVTAVADADPAAVHSFVLVGWGRRIRVAVSGTTELSSDHRSLPRLSGATAGTWVERNLPGDTGIVLRCGDGALLAHTALVEGTVASGGFQLRLQPAQDPAGASDEPAPAAPRATGAHDVPTPPVVPGTGPERPRRGTGFAALGEEGEDTGDEDLPAGRPAALEPVPDDLADVANHADLARDAEPAASGQLVACPRCMSPVDGAARTCPTCGHRLDAAARTSEGWFVELGDGRTEWISTTLRLGRNPGAPPGGRAVTVTSELVSAEHVEILTGPHGVHLVDLGSRNGTFVLTTGDARFVAIEPGQPHRVADGTVVQIGRERFTVRKGPGTADSDMP